MNIRDLAREVLIKKDGIAKAGDFVAVGIRANNVTKLCNEGYLERVKHGYYRLAHLEDVSDEQLLATTIPDGVVCMESALFHYGYSDFVPRKWSIAVPRAMSRTKLNDELIALQAYYVQENIYEIGKTVGEFNGVKLAVYDRERTICDCFKYRARLDSEIFNKAIKVYANDEQKNLKTLSEYAKKLRVYKKVMELMGVLLNG